MATFYRGYRPIHPLRSNNPTHPVKNKVGTYSYWDLYNTTQLLDGFPDRNVQPGAGDYPHGYQLSRAYRGLDEDVAYTRPMSSPGSGTRLSYHRFHPHEYKGLTATRALGSPGHAARRFAYTYSRNSTTLYFSGVASANPLLNGGHVVRGIGASGTAATFGRFAPHEYKGIPVVPLASAGRTKPAVDATGVYGHDHVNEYFGVPSAKAL